MTQAAEVTTVGGPAEPRLAVDARGRICEANGAAHRLLHYDAESLVGLPLAWIMPASRHVLVEKLKRACQDRARCDFAAGLLREDGSVIAVWMTAQPYRGPDGPWLALSLAPDEEPTSAIQRASVAAASHAARSARASPPPLPPAATRPRRGKTIPLVPALSQGSVRPAAPVSTRTARTTQPFVPHVDVGEQLTACMELLRWLDGQLERQGRRDTPRERGLVQIAAREALALLEVCQTALSLKAKQRSDD